MNNLLAHFGEFVCHNLINFGGASQSRTFCWLQLSDPKIVCFLALQLGIFNWHIYNVFIFQSWQNSNVTTSLPEVKWCEERTACKWLVYGRNPLKKIELTIPTKTCICSETMECSLSEDNLSMGAFVYRCLLKPITDSTTPFSSWSWKCNRSFISL